MTSTAPAVGKTPKQQQRGPFAWVGAFTGFYPPQADEFCPPRPGHPVPLRRPQRDPGDLGAVRGDGRPARRRPTGASRSCRSSWCSSATWCCTRSATCPTTTSATAAATTPRTRRAAATRCTRSPAARSRRGCSAGGLVVLGVAGDWRSRVYFIALRGWPAVALAVVGARAALRLRRRPARAEGTRPRRGRRVRGLGPADDRAAGTTSSPATGRGRRSPSRCRRASASCRSWSASTSTSASSTPASTSAPCRCCSASAARARLQPGRRSRRCTSSPRSPWRRRADARSRCSIVLAAPAGAAGAAGDVARRRPAEPPAGYVGWPLWYHRVCLVHNRLFGWLFIAGLALGAIFPARARLGLIGLTGDRWATLTPCQRVSTSWRTHGLLRHGRDRLHRPVPARRAARPPRGARSTACAGPARWTRSTS